MTNFTPRLSRVRSFGPQQGTRSFGELPAQCSPEGDVIHKVLRRRTTTPVLTFTQDVSRSGVDL